MNKDKTELEETKIRLIRDITKPLDCKDVCVVSISDVETVLQALEDAQKNYELSIKQNISYKQNIYDLKRNSIPKKKIKDKIEELDITENGESLEDIMNRQNYTITELIQFVLQELLKE